MIGRSVGKYRILDRIGRGGMGTVYHAIDDTLQREVAIKVLNAEMTDPEALKRFKAEAIALAKLHHPAIATLFELHEEDGDMMMVMEFVHGETLQKLAERMGPMPPDFAAHLCTQALDGLAHAHRAGIVHRDLKPGNIMVTDEGVVKVMDFGIARIAGSEHLTSDGLAMGTPAYMAPEQVLGQEVDARADLYAMGVVLYRLWTGRPPFDGDTPFAIAHKQINNAPPSLSVAGAHLPVWCDVVLSRALAKDRADRFQTAQEFKGALLESASVMSPDDIATVTMRTPRVPLDTTRVRRDMDPRSSGVRSPAPAVPDAHPADPWPPTRPPTGAVKDPTGATVSGATLVISARHMFAGVGAVVLIVALLAIGAVVAIRRAQPPAAPAVGAVAATPSPQPTTRGLDGTATAIPLASPPPTQAPSSAVIAAPRQSSPPARPQSPTMPGISTPVPAGSAAGRGTRGPGEAAEIAKPVPADATVSPSASSAAALPPIAFNKVKLLVLDGSQAREEDADLEFAGGNILIYDGHRRVLASLPYATVRVSSTSRSRQPRWRQPSGAVTDARTGGGALGFIKSERTWIGIATQKTAYVFRVDDGRSAQLSSAITQRTGVPVVRLK